MIRPFSNSFVLWLGTQGMSKEHYEGLSLSDQITHDKVYLRTQGIEVSLPCRAEGCFGFAHTEEGLCRACAGLAEGRNPDLESSKPSVYIPEWRTEDAPTTQSEAALYIMVAISVLFLFAVLATVFPLGGGK